MYSPSDKGKDSSRTHESKLSISETPSPRHIRTKAVHHLKTPSQEGSTPSKSHQKQTSISKFPNHSSRTRNYEGNRRSKAKPIDGNDRILASLTSNEVYLREAQEHSKDSEETTRKQTGYFNTSQTQNRSEIVFTPPGKEDTIKEGYIKDGYDIEQEGETEYFEEELENDRTHSPEPLSSKLIDEKMKVYRTGNMEELESEYRKSIESNINGKSNDMNECNNTDLQAVLQVSGDKQAPSETPTYDDNDQPEIEFFSMEDDPSKSNTEIDSVRVSKVTQKHEQEQNLSNDNSERSQNIKTYQAFVANSKGQTNLSKSQENHDTKGAEIAELERYLQETKQVDPSDETVEQKTTPQPTYTPGGAYLVQSNFLSGITEKTEEESVVTNNLGQHSHYMKDKDRDNATLLKQEAFLSSNSSARSSRINSRLLRYFEDSLQKEIPMSMSPSVKPDDKSLEDDISLSRYKDDQNYTEYNIQDNDYGEDEEEASLSQFNKRSKTKSRKRGSSQDNISNYSLSKSNNYEDTGSNYTSNKKRQYRYFFTKKHNTDSEGSNNDIPKITFEHLESKGDSLNSSMTRKERYIDNFMESAREDNILQALGENDKNLNISAISKLEDSTSSKKQPVSEDEKTEKESNNDKQMSRQPTFSSFTPQPKDDKEYIKNKQDDFHKDSQNKSENRGQDYNSYPDSKLRDLSLSLSGMNENDDSALPASYNGKDKRPSSCLKSSECTQPQFFISSDTKNLNVSSEGSRKYRSPTFEAISEEGNENSRYIVDSPTHKRLSMDVDFNDKLGKHRMTKRPPSIHAALSPESEPDL